MSNKAMVAMLISVTSGLIYVMGVWHTIGAGVEKVIYMLKIYFKKIISINLFIIFIFLHNLFLI